MASNEGIWTGLLKWSLAQPNYGAPSDAKPMSEEDKQFLRNVFDSLVVDEVKRMKVIVEILRMPDDEPGIKRLTQESAEALAKLKEVGLPQGEAAHYGAHKPASAASAAGSTLAVPATAASSSSKRSPSPGRTPSPAAVAAAAAQLGAVPTVTDYQKADIPALRAEMVRRKEGALEELDDRVLTSDNANDFMTVGGLEPLLICLLSPHDGVKWRAAQALSTCVQNNPKAQTAALRARAIDYLLPLLSPPAALPANATEAQQAAQDERWTVVVKALTAVSALVRAEDIPQLRDSFMAGQGLARLSALAAPSAHATPRVQTKVFLLLKHVLAWFPHVKQHLAAAGTLPHLVALLGKGSDTNHREALAACLCEFAKPSGTRTDVLHSKALREKPLGLKPVLEARIKAIQAAGKASKDDKDMLEEELQSLLSLYKLCKF